MWMAWPRSAATLAIVDISFVAATLTLVATALFAPEYISDRAFRLLPWAAKPAASEVPADRPD